MYALQFIHTQESGTTRIQCVLYNVFQTPTTTKTKKKERIIKDTHRKRDRSSKNVVQINNNNKQKENATVCSLYSSVPSTTLRKLNFS